MNETIPSADPEQVAGAVLFLNEGFQKPALIQTAYSRKLPKVCKWAQEWRNINTGETRMEDASLEFRQIITAVNIALIEGMKNNLRDLAVGDVRKDLDEKDLIAKQVGDIQAPPLDAKFKQVRGEIEKLLGRETQKSARRWRFGL